MKMAYNDYNFDLSFYLQNDDIAKIWDDIKNNESYIFGNKKDNNITKAFFKALGGAYNRSQYIADEEMSFRKDFPKEVWLQNLHGDQYRQHETGRGALTPLAPSEESIKIFEKEIKKGSKPFTNLEDLKYILGKIENPIDRFGLEAIALNKPICAAPSGTAIRMMNLWDEISAKIKSNPNLYNGKMPNNYQMEQLCKTYLCGSRSHHTALEVETVLRNRRPANAFLSSNVSKAKQRSVDDFSIDYRTKNNLSKRKNTDSIKSKL